MRRRAGRGGVGGAQLYRLSAVTYPNGDTQSYTYDPMGNRLTKVHNGTPTSYTYDDADQMTAAGGVTYGYDNNGNQTTRGTDTFGYNTENRLTSTNLAGVAGSYVYNGNGLRTSRAIGATTTTFAWGNATGMPVILRDSAGNRYLYGLDLISVSNSQNKKFYYHTDGLGSTTAITSSTGAVQKTYQYDVFGAIRTQTGTQPNEFTFTGEQVDTTGMQYLRARYYDNATGRFLSQDPLPLLQRYPYVGNNPVNLVDPYGLIPCPGCGIVKDIVTKPVNDFKDTVEYIDTMIDHPGSVIQNSLGLAVARLSFGDRFEAGGTVFYENCWGACWVFRAFPNARTITVGHFVFGRGAIGPITTCHELAHVRQGDKYGVTWLPRYFWESQGGYDSNRFEQEAYAAQGECTDNYE